MILHRHCIWQKVNEKIKLKGKHKDVGNKVNLLIYQLTRSSITQFFPILWEKDAENVF